MIWGSTAAEVQAMNETGSLQNLNDIVVPAAVPWWPPAPGWYVLAAGLAMVLAVVLIRWLRARRRNLYRRLALRELAGIRQDPSDQTLLTLPQLLKRTALAAWPRDRVAALSGAEWHRFLDESAGMDLFQSGAGEVLDRLAYPLSPARLPPQRESSRLLDAAEHWLKNHDISRGGVD